jgi:uncharacterized membrane protein
MLAYSTMGCAKILGKPFFDIPLNFFATTYIPIQLTTSNTFEDNSDYKNVFL